MFGLTNQPNEIFSFRVQCVISGIKKELNVFNMNLLGQYDPRVEMNDTALELYLSKSIGN